MTVTTVVPGLMRTGSHLQARFTGQAGKEFTWFALGASLPLLSMDAERAARRIIEAVRAAATRFNERPGQHRVLGVDRPTVRS